MGCRLHIKGQETLLRYLFDKATGRSDGGGIPECDLYGEQEPWEIWEAYGDGTNLRENKNALYLFTKSKKKSAKDSRLDRTVGAGSWKGEDTGTKIFLKERSGIATTLFGMRKRFHYESKNGCLHDGRWIMHEYSLDAATLVNAKVRMSAVDQEYVFHSFIPYRQHRTVNICPV
ncbi:NAC domain-containing protein 66 [Morella rubra]|uniref:NAC domain-containing protein 66 n=1 Tax=Morella rubra TaxID=262757 RepID=A0A6A1WS69_9ROSI|nr:NAC domain-containing protein 66 [Morella rubra]